MSQRGLELRLGASVNAAIWRGIADLLRSLRQAGADSGQAAASGGQAVAPGWAATELKTAAGFSSVR